MYINCHWNVNYECINLDLGTSLLVFTAGN